MGHSHKFRWGPGATPEGTYCARLYKDSEGQRVAIVDATPDNTGPSPINAASVGLREKVRALWSPPPERVLVAQESTVTPGSPYHEIDDSGDPSISLEAKSVEGWTSLTE